MFDPKSDYALNKMAPDAIVYKNAAGEVTRLTQDDFPSLEEFQRWKAWSDENYHDTEKASHVYYNHTRSLHGLSEKAVAVPSPEDAMIEDQEQRERRELRRRLMTDLDSCLTPTQRHRLWLYCVDGLTVRQIAEAENIKHQSVVECLTAAKNKLQIFLKKME